MRVRFFEAVKKVQSATSSYFNVAPEYSALAAAGVAQSIVNANEPAKQPESVPMKPTKQEPAPTSNGYVLQRLKKCATSYRGEADIFIALLPKQQLNPDQVNELAAELAKNGKARELDALAANYNLSRESVTNLIQKQENPKLYQALLEEQDNLQRLNYLFDPKSEVTVVEASDKRSIINATTEAATGNSPKRIIEVDTTEAYEPKFRERVVRTSDYVSALPQNSLFNKGAALNRVTHHANARVELPLMTSLQDNFADRSYSSVRTHI